MAIVHDAADRKGSEFFFNAWNGDTGYTLDLDLDTLLGDWIGADPRFGQTASSTLDAGVVAASNITDGVIYDGALTNFAETFGSDFENIEWTLVAYDNDNYPRTIVTADAGSTVSISDNSESDLTNNQVELLAGTLDNMATQVNSFAGTADADTFYATTSTDGAAYAGNFGETYQGNAFDTSNTLGATSDLYLLTQSSQAPSKGNDAAVIRQLGDEAGAGIEVTTYEASPGVWNLKIEATGDAVTYNGYTEPVVEHTSAFAQADVDSFAQLEDGSYVLVGKNGTNETFEAESIVFTDGTVSVTDFAATATSAPVWSGFVPTVFTDPNLPNIEYQLLGQETGDSVIAGDTNDFINLLGGDDAAQGGAGDDIIDGGLGSNFLTGDAGGDTFFIDGRGAPSGAITWSTITDFDASAGDTVNIWGWVEGTSKLALTQESAGVGAFTGFTHHYDLDNDGTIDTSITFSGASTAPNSEARIIGEEGYQFYGA